MIEDDMPEEDKYLEPTQWRSHYTPSTCVHDWVDLYNGGGVDRDNVNVGLATFFCKKCLAIRQKTFDLSRFRLNDDLEEDRGGE